MDMFEDLPQIGKSSSEKSSAIKKRTVSVDLFADLPDGKEIKSKTLEIEKNKLEGVLPEKRKHDPKDYGGPVTKRSTTECYQMKGYVAKRKGEREEMQDAYVIINDLTKLAEDLDCTISRLAYYAVFDGHAGSRASKYAAENLHKTLVENLSKKDFPKIEKEIKRYFIDSYKKTDEEFLKEASKRKPSWKDGSTATTILAINNTLYIGNLGDSKAIICRYNEKTSKYMALPLTKDHNPTQYEERMRIQKSGGHVRDGRIMGVLEVSRSLGDGPYKNHGVICTPDVKRCQLTNNDRFLMIACDGLWKKFDNDSAIEFINKTLDNPSIQGTDTKSETDVKFETSCSKIANEAVLRLSADNVTVILVSIEGIR